MRLSRADKYRTRWLPIVLALIGGLVTNAGAFGGEASEPRLSDAEIGHLRHFVALARQDRAD